MFYLLSDELVENRTKVFAEAVRYVLSGVEGYFVAGKVLDHMNMLFSDGCSFPSHDMTEIGRWDHRYLCDAVTSFEVEPSLYFAWVDPQSWAYDPNFVLYSKTEFMTLFADCCRNLVLDDPSRREEFDHALAIHGMTL